MDKTLFAKSAVAGKPPKTLVDHTTEVISCVTLLFGTADTPKRLGREWLRFFRMEDDAWGRFFVNVMAAAALHDIGKANDSFQKAIGHTGDQAIRHEHLSGLLISLPDFKRFLKQHSLIDFDVVRAAVISHHLKTDPSVWGQQLGIAETFRVLADTPDFPRLLEIAQVALGLSAPFCPRIPALWSFEPLPHTFCLGDILEEAKADSHRLRSSLEKTLSAKFYC
jgi:CRISPR-associated endonuclease/helicase Cas3